MTRSGNKGFGALLTDGLDEAVDTEMPAPAESVMASRSNALARLATGKVVTDRTEFVDPDRCRPWRLHNRELDHLNEDTCRDLIDAFLSAKRQRIPAIVRRLQGDPDYDFEIVAGVRRWWTVKWLRANHHPDFEYLVTIQRLTDEESFRVSDLENRSRKDISDWERAREYTRALVEFYDSSQSSMAEHLNISKSWLSRLLDVGRLPGEIVRAFSDTHDITVRIAREIKPLVSERDKFARMAQEAERLEHERQEDGVRLSAVEVTRRLLRASKDPTEPTVRAQMTEVKSAKGKPMLRYIREKKGGNLTVKILRRSGAEPKEVLAAIERLLA